MKWYDLSIVQNYLRSIKSDVDGSLMIIYPDQIIAIIWNM